MAVGRKKKADGELVLALACGATPEQAAQKTGLSLRTVYRRLQEASIHQQVQEIRTDMLQRSAGMFTAAGLAAVKTLTKLQDGAASESVRLGAARAVIELGYKIRETIEVTERLSALEKQLAQLLNDPTLALESGSQAVQISSNSGVSQ